MLQKSRLQHPPQYMQVAFIVNNKRLQLLEENEAAKVGGWGEKKKKKITSLPYMPHSKTIRLPVKLEQDTAGGKDKRCFFLNYMYPEIY